MLSPRAGSIVHFRSLTAHCDAATRTVVVAVAVEMQDPHTRALSTTNTFYFTFRMAASEASAAAAASSSPSLSLSSSSEANTLALPELIPTTCVWELFLLTMHTCIQPFLLDAYLCCDFHAHSLMAPYMYVL